MKTKSLYNFIREHRLEIDHFIAMRLEKDTNPRPNDDERRQWILNDESLYNWARSEGVRI